MCGASGAFARSEELFHKNCFEAFLGGSGDVMKTNTNGKPTNNKNAMASGRFVIQPKAVFPLGREFVDCEAGGEFAVLLIKYEQAAYMARTVASHFTQLNPSVALQMI